MSPKEKEQVERVIRELKDLAGRQDILGRITRDLGQGKNRAN